MRRLLAAAARSALAPRAPPAPAAVSASARLPGRSHSRRASAAPELLPSEIAPRPPAWPQALQAKGFATAAAAPAEDDGGDSGLKFKAGARAPSALD